MALTLTALTDVIELPEVSALHEQGDYQTFGYWPAIGKVMADVGFFGYVNLTDFDATAVQWDPGNNATDGVVLATAPAKRRWYLEGTGPDLVLVGWTDEAVTAPAPFVIEMPVSRLTPDGGVVVTAGEVELVSHTPVVIAPDGEGMVVAAGEAELVAHLPVEVTPDGPGEVVTAGEVRLTVAGHIAPEDPGSVVTAGELVSGGLVAQVYPDGLGGLVELALTQGTWPGAARAGAVPKTFDRMNNRRYGGELAGSGRPPWWTPIDEDNPLAEYVAFWSWMQETPRDYPVPDVPGLEPDEQRYTHRQAVKDASGTQDGLAMHVLDAEATAIVTSDIPGASQSYTALPYSGTGPEGADYLHYVGEDGLWKIICRQYGGYGAGYPRWCLVDAADNTVAYGGTTELQYPWEDSWAAVGAYSAPSVVQGTPMQKAWGETGLSIDHAVSLVTSEWRYAYPGLIFPMTGALTAPYTLIFDYTPETRGTRYLFVHGWIGGYGQALVELYEEPAGSGQGLTVRGPGGYVLFDGADCFEGGARHRVVFAVDASWQGSMYHNGQQVGTTQDCSDLEMPVRPPGYAQNYTTAFGNPAQGVFVPPGWLDPQPLVGTGGTFYGIIHEFGFLDGYAATAADVANNAMFAIPYGARGSMLPVTDAPVA